MTNVQPTAKCDPDTKKSPEAASLTLIVYLMELKKQMTKTEICVGQTTRGQTGSCMSCRGPDPKN